MKLFAQHGHQPSDKMRRGLGKGVINGIIYSPRFIKPTILAEKIEEANSADSSAEIYIDPEFYATRQSGTENNQLGYLEEWPHFRPQRRRDMIIKANIVEDTLRNSFETMNAFNLTGFIAPNIYIPQSFDSMEAGISQNFIGRTKQIFKKFGGKTKVFSTLAIDHQALLNPVEFKSFLNDITALDNPPDGFYVLIGCGLIDERTDLVHSEIRNPEIIGGWMFINYILSINGFRVLNGFSDVISPFLGVVGGEAGATGWWSNLRVFSMGRYIKSERGGGRLPNIKYLSNRLLNRITIEEKNIYSRMVPEVNNNLSCDPEYLDRVPDRTVEALQAWEAISALNQNIISDDLEKGLNNLKSAIRISRETYAHLSSRGFSEGIEAITEYLNALDGALEVFKRLAEF